MIRASAPGKLMLAGEYTVSGPGGVALAVAIDRRLTVEVDSLGSDWRVSSEALGLVDAEPETVPIVARALEVVEGLPPGGRVVIRGDLGVGAKKPGFGGSAALSAAVLVALRRLSGAHSTSIGDVVELHRSVQGGRGSGYDVATVMTGGVTLFDNRNGRLLCRRVDWPSGLHAAVFFTGTGASTVALLDRVACWQAEDPEDMRAYLGPLGEETRELMDAWVAGDIGRILTAAAQVQEELDAFDRAGEIGIYAGGQMQLLAAVEDAGAIGRTSGAGGGDCLWALSDRIDVIERATRAAADLGFERLDVGFPAAELAVEEVG
ncbi:MAG: hypothetical protein CVU56_06510 [Deltaproteobacteria bacterium HGW-Deltaproteobacteria-14]|nr:MAG: hypothetical protein CVU56_06510 [Deltaproteobacteria bacterium HGW-Deltaproteobacteria-14]